MEPTLNWDSVTVAIPTMPQRAQLLGELLRQVEAECQGATVVVHRHPPGGDARADFPALIRASLATDQEWLLQLEDDVVLAPGFCESALDALRHGAHHGVCAVSLFSRSKRDMDLLSAGKRWRSQSPSSFCMMQGIFLRSASLDGFADWAPSWYASHPEHTGRAADLLLGAWLSKRRSRMLVHVPSLVQHRNVPSTIPGHRGERASPTYRHAFGD